MEGIGRAAGDEELEARGPACPDVKQAAEKVRDAFKT
jgi:uncharacterized protein YjbJ (UPF0337 family)